MQDNIQQTNNQVEVQSQDAIVVQDVCHYYKVYNDDGTISQTVGVEGVSLTIKEGSFVALVGHNGCGKSTFAKLLNGLLQPTSGKVLVYGKDTADKDSIYDIRKNVGMVFQNPDNQMVASIVEEDVAFGPENLGVPQAEIVTRVQNALNQVGMSQFAKHSPSKLSGGQKQRIAIAGALAIMPKVLVLDESTAMLDPQGRHEVLQVVHELNKQGMTVVLITHFMEEVLDCDNVVVMHEGHVVSQGTPMQVFENKALLDKVGLQAPRTVMLAQMLANAGFDVNKDCTKIKDLGEQVCLSLGK